jgi:hypothetical protein
MTSDHELCVRPDCHHDTLTTTHAVLPRINDNPNFYCTYCMTASGLSAVLEAYLFLFPSPCRKTVDFVVHYAFMTKPQYLSESRECFRTFQPQRLGRQSLSTYMLTWRVYVYFPYIDL